MTPALHTSTAAPYGTRRMISGAMYAAVPTPSRSAGGPLGSKCVANPKSQSSHAGGRQFVPNATGTLRTIGAVSKVRSIRPRATAARRQSPNLEVRVVCRRAQQEVLGLDVAVRDPARVQVVERREQRPDEPARVRLRVRLALSSRAARGGVGMTFYIEEGIQRWQFDKRRSPSEARATIPARDGRGAPRSDRPNGRTNHRVSANTHAPARCDRRARRPRRGP